MEVRPWVSNVLIGTGIEYQLQILACKHDYKLLEVIANKFNPTVYVRI